MIRQNGETWTNIFRNLREDNEEVEVIWLDPGDSSKGEWVLAFDCELFEDGFTSEQEAQRRLNHVEKLYYGEAE
jgi:hypothetical protein